jgi:quercetin dioxygenase-like cupin family protein
MQRLAVASGKGQRLEQFAEPVAHFGRSRLCKWYPQFIKKWHFTQARSVTIVGLPLLDLEEQAMTLRLTLALIACLFSAVAFAHEKDTKQTANAPQPPYSITPVMKQAMSDSGLEGYELLSVRLDLVPGGTDNAPHRHDADLFVYVLQGSIEVELDGRKATYSAGSMFHEPRNVLHSLLRNTSADQPASALAVFVIKAGREFLVPVAK